jgi:predicted transcriptional regulator
VIRRLARTDLTKRAVDVLAYFDRPRTSNGPTEAINGRLDTSYRWYHLYMVKTTVYLPENTKQRVAEAARRSGQSEAEFIRTAIEQRTDAVLPRNRGRWGTIRFSETGLAHRVDEVLAEGFGEL